MAEASEWAAHKPLHDAVLAEPRGGREWPFAVGDEVHARGDWGSLCCDLRIYTGAHPDAVLTVDAVSDGGRWLSLRDEGGRVHRGYGPTYFRVAGECGNHFPGYRTPGWPRDLTGAYYCLRCDEPIPDITRVLRGDLTGKENADA